MESLNIGIIGAGLMGREMAAAAALESHNHDSVVTLRDKSTRPGLLSAKPVSHHNGSVAILPDRFTMAGGL